MITRRHLLSGAPAVLLASSTAASPVLVELFTSEGCSSCPPADDLLSRLTLEQPGSGVSIVALGLHVDYWNRLGWTDPFSKSEFSARQQWYASGFRNNGPYTPQMVVDGVAEFVGSDSRQAERALQAAVRSTKRPVKLTWDKDLHIDIPAASGGTPSDIVLALTEDRLTTNVQRGENGGRTLRHAAVVRSWKKAGTLHPDKGFSATEALALDPAWKRENLSAVVFAQQRSDRRVVAVASARLTST